MVTLDNGSAVVHADIEGVFQEIYNVSGGPWADAILIRSVCRVITPVVDALVEKEIQVYV